MKILADTNIWIDHLRNDNPQLRNALLEGRIVTHDHIIGELSLGSLKHRDKFLENLKRLPKIQIAREEEVLHVIEVHSLFSKGIGYTDVHLLAAALIDGNTQLWTLDKRLDDISQQLGL